MVDISVFSISGQYQKLLRQRNSFWVYYFFILSWGSRVRLVPHRASRRRDQDREGRWLAMTMKPARRGRPQSVPESLLATVFRMSEAGYGYQRIADQLFAQGVDTSKRG